MGSDMVAMCRQPWLPRYLSLVSHKWLPYGDFFICYATSKLKNVVQERRQN